MIASPSAGFMEHLCALLSLSLAHFLWQGVLIAVAGAAAATALRHRSASTRYLLYTLAMAAMAICPIATLLVLRISEVESRRPPTARPIAVVMPPADNPPAQVTHTPQTDFVNISSIPAPPPRHLPPIHADDADLRQAPAAPAIDPVAKPPPNPLQSHARTIVAVYLMGVAFMLARTAYGIKIAGALRRSAEPVRSQFLLEMLLSRAQAFGIVAIPPLAASALAAAPCLIGVLKPMILLPTAMLNGLSPDQLAAILAHELAHLRRFDHWISLAQRIVEAILFFHPAVWWISRRISLEREICCDDLVIAGGNSRMVYADALVRVAELCRAIQAGPALAATGRPSELRRRIARLVGGSSEHEFVPQRNWVAAVLAPILFAAVLTLGFFDSAVSAQNSGPRIVFEDGFENGPRGEWSKPLISVAPGDNRQYLGPFNAETISLNLRNLPAHHSARVSFDMLVLRSWDGSDESHGPDFFAVTTGDGRVLHCTNFSAIGVEQAFPGYFGVNLAPPWTGVAARDTLGITYKGEPKDGIYHFDIPFPHRDVKLTLRFMVGLDGDINDEAWGMDNVRVTVDDMAAPAASELAVAWEQLGSADATLAAKAVATLVAGGDQTTELIAPKLAATSLPSEMVLLSVSRAEFTRPESEDGVLYALSDASRRQTALAAHVLQLVGTDSAKAALKKLMPKEPATAPLPVIVHEKGTGKPVAFFPLLVRPASTSGFFLFTDESGRAELILPPQTQSVSLRAPRNIWLPVSKAVRLTGGEAPPAKIDMEVERGMTIGGKVTDDTGQPIEGAIVKFAFNSSAPGGSLSYWDPHAMTNSEGRWSYDLAPTGNSPIRIGVFHPRYAVGASPSIPLISYPSLDELREGKAVHTLRSGVPVEGVVYGSDGNPIAGAWVDWGNDRGTNSQIIPAQSTDAQGRFVYAALPNTEVILTVRAKGHSPEQRQFRVGNDPMDLRFDLRPGKPLTGRVIDQHGNPIPSARVYISTWHGMTLYDIPIGTDSDGRFTWPDAPDDAVVGYVYKTGYSERENVTFRPGQENVVTLNAPGLVLGTVVDDATGQPVTGLTLTVGIVPRDGNPTAPISWQRGSTLGQPKIKDNAFELKLTDRYVYAVRIEADGYMPADSPTFPVNTAERALEFRLKKGESLHGVVLDAAGKPVGGAEIDLIPPRMGFQVTNGKLPDLGRRIVSTRSGKDGGFSVPPQAEQFLLLVLHDTGYARVSSDEFAKVTTVTLRAWTTIEGTVKASGQPAAGAQVLGSTSETITDPNQPRVYFSVNASADEQGHFHIDRAPATTIRLGRRVPMGDDGYTIANQVRVDAQPGQTATIAIGGLGRAVVGKIILPDEIAKVAWVGERGQIFIPVSVPQPKRPDDYATMTPQQRQEWSQKFLQSDEGKAYVKAQQEAADSRRAYPFSLDGDGAFRIEDVEPGTYELHALITAPPEVGRGMTVGKELAIANGTVTVPQYVDNDQLTLPPIKAQVLKNLTADDVAPPFEVPSLDGRQIKLQDFRGKFVLLNFWGSWCNPCVVETPHYKEVFDTFGKDERFVMINLSLDPSIEDARKFVEKEKLKWSQGYLGDWSDEKVSAEYGVRSIPSLWLIGPDGKIIARDLRGEAIKAAVEKALKHN